MTRVRYASPVEVAGSRRGVTILQWNEHFLNGPGPNSYSRFFASSFVVVRSALLQRSLWPFPLIDTARVASATPSKSDQEAARLPNPRRVERLFEAGLVQQGGQVLAQAASRCICHPVLPELRTSDAITCTSATQTRLLPTFFFPVSLIKCLIDVKGRWNKCRRAFSRRIFDSWEPARIGNA